VILWADPERIAAAVRDYAETLRERHAGVTAIYWYGSWVSGRATPSSDVDLCVVVASDDRRYRDRLPDYLPENFPVGMDLIVLTEAEMRGLPERAPSWHRAIVSGERV
jgi:predicted nucleotidyltransferase